MTFAQLFYVGGISLAVLAMPTALVFLAWRSRNRREAAPVRRPADARAAPARLGSSAPTFG